MNEEKKLNAEDDSSSFNRLPEDIVLEILNKVKDLKTLCLCKLVSKPFASIVSQVETISFTFSTYPLVDTPNLGSYGSAIGSLMKFLCVKYVCIQLPSSFDDHFLFKWKFNLMIINSFIFLSPNSVCNNKVTNANENGQEAAEEDDWELTGDIACECFKDVVMRVKLAHHINRLPLLENVVITDLGKRGKVSLGRKKHDFKSWRSLPTRPFVSEWRIPFLKLPVSGYVMKGVKLYLFHWYDPANEPSDNLMKSEDDDDFEDEEEAAYSEAMREILNKHRDRLISLA